MRSRRFVYLPRGVMHQSVVEGSDPARLLIIASRTALEQFFAEVTSEVTTSERPPDLEPLDRVWAAGRPQSYRSGRL